VHPIHDDSTVVAQGDHNKLAEVLIRRKTPTESMLKNDGKEGLKF